MRKPDKEFRRNSNLDPRYGRYSWGTNWGTDGTYSTGREPGKVPCLLAHVMAHEITHMLQGVSRHSLTGVMKPRWDRNDYSQMAWRPLAFTEGDIALIQLGMKARER